jgi:hypothetical protein
MTSNDDLLDYCPNCGTVDYPVLRKSGSTVVEVLLWLFLLVPGVVYSIWRVASKRLVCPKCEHPGTIPLDSPIAKKALAQNPARPISAPIVAGSR